MEKSVLNNFILMMIKYSFFLWLVLFFGISSSAFAREGNFWTCAKCYTVSPFAEHSSDAWGGGVEINRWVHWFDLPDYSYPVDSLGRQNGPADARWLWYGGGLRIYFGEAANGFYASPYLLGGTFFGLLGVAAGPEFGISDSHADFGGSARAWLSLVGIEVVRTIRKPLKMELYVFVPIYAPWIDAYY